MYGFGHVYVMLRDTRVEVSESDGVCVFGPPCVRIRRWFRFFVFCPPAVVLVLAST